MNWTSLIADLKRSGWTQSRIAERVGASQPTISALATGSATSTTYEIGAGLVALHAEVMAKAKAEA